MIVFPKLLPVNLAIFDQIVTRIRVVIGQKSFICLYFRHEIYPGRIDVLMYLICTVLNGSLPMFDTIVTYSYFPYTGIT